MTTQEETYSPVKVHVASVEAGVLLGAAPKKLAYTAHYETFTLTANDQSMCILPEDPTRVEAYILAIDNDIVIGTKGQVVAANNVVTSVPQPVGTYVPKALTAPFKICDCNAVYAGVTTTGSNSRVSVAAYYRS